MELVRKSNGTNSIFKCKYCEQEVERRTDTGKASHSCGNKECHQAYRIEANHIKYPNSIMNAVKDLGFLENKRGEMQHMIRYECPHCYKEVDIVINRGFKQQSCGSRECQNKALKVDGKEKLLQEIGGQTYSSSKVYGVA